MGQINTNNYPTVDSLADADLLIVENAVHGTGTTTPKQLRENAIGTTPLQTTAQTVTGAINEILEMAEALHGIGKATSVSNNIVDTDIDLGRAPKIGDRILVLFDSSVFTVDAIKTYNGSTAIQTDWEYVPVLDFHLNGVCIIEFIADPFSPDPTIICARLVRMFEGTVYTAGTGISLSNNKITNTLPQMGVNIDGGKINSVSSGNLGFYSKASTFVVMVFNCDAVPYNGEYHLSLSQSGSVAIMYDAVLVDPVTGGRYGRNIKKYTTLICEVTNSGSGSESDPILVNVIGEITNDLADKVDAILDAISEEKTVSGNPIVITDALPLPAKSLQATLEPIQDLHGYDHPWAGGAGKNLLPMTVSGIKALNTYGTWSGNVYTYRGVTFTLLTDSDNNVIGVKINGGPASNNALMDIPVPTISANMLLSSGVAYSSTSAFLQGANSDGTTYYNANESGVSIPSGASVNRIYCAVLNGKTANNVTLYPMLRLSTETDATFAPYSNICPISGRTEARVDTENEDSTESAYATIQLGTTVYGADINFTTGELTVKTAKVVMNGQDDFAPNKWAASGSHSYRWYSTTVATGDYINDDNVRASYLEKQNGEGAGVPAFAQSTSSTSQNLYIFNADMLDSSIVDTTTLCAYLEDNPLEVTYKLATPTTLQLTPAQLQMLKGYNRVSMDNGTITLTYKADRLAAIEAALAAL